jgi:hypothetical protein
MVRLSRRTPAHDADAMLTLLRGEKVRYLDAAGSFTTKEEP